MAVPGYQTGALAGATGGPTAGRAAMCCHAQAQPVLAEGRTRCCCPADAPCNMEQAPVQVDLVMHISQPPQPQAPTGCLFGKIPVEKAASGSPESLEARRPPEAVPIYLRTASLLI